MDGLTITFSKSQTLQGVIMDAGWKVCEFSEIEATTSKTDKEGYTVQLTIVAPEKYNGVKIPSWHYDEIGMGTLHKLVEAIMEKKVTPGQYNAAALIGKKLKVYTQPGSNPNNGLPTNQITEFAAMSYEKAVVRG